MLALCIGEGKTKTLKSSDFSLASQSTLSTRQEYCTRDPQMVPYPGQVTIYLQDRS